MKKIALLLIVITICFTLISCSSNENNINTVESNNSLSVENTIENNNETNSCDPTTSKNEDNQNKTVYNDRIVKDLFISTTNGTIISIDAIIADEILNIESSHESVNVEEGMKLGSIILVFDNEEEYLFGTIFIGKDKNYYLKLDFNEKIYKLADDFMK